LIEFRALTIKGVGGRLNSLSCDVHIATPSAATGLPRLSLPFRAVWDTGATASVITPKVASDLNLAATGMAQVQTANGRRDSNVYLVDIELPQKVRVQNLRVTDGDIFGCDVLIGMDIISMGDFSVTNIKGITTMSFRLPSIKEIDYVEEANQLRLLGTTSRKGRRAATLAHRKAKKKSVRG
jgi:predicted aspartyl protease